MSDLRARARAGGLPGAAVLLRSLPDGRSRQVAGRLVPHRRAGRGGRPRRGPARRPLQGTRVRTQAAAMSTSGISDEVWTRYVSVTVVVLAVATTLASAKTQSYANKVVISQAQASDAWASYQAKSVKQRLAEMDARRAIGEEAA